MQVNPEEDFVDCYNHGQTIHHRAQQQPERAERGMASSADFGESLLASPSTGNVDDDGNNNNNGGKILKKKHCDGNGVNNNGWDDQHYDYIMNKGDVVASRYKIQRFIGKGNFGQVIHTLDLVDRKDVAIKILKSKRNFFAKGMRELELLKRVREKSGDKANKHRVVLLLTQFMYRNHLCLVMEALSLNLFQVMESTGFQGLSLSLIRNFGRDLLSALSFLSRPDVDIIHGDLKPENIVLRKVSPCSLTRHCDIDAVLSNETVTLVDFGSACRSNKPIHPYFQSRFYRAPEAMLQAQPYSCAVDIWSLGCVLVELHKGAPLFAGKTRLEQMEKVVEVLGMVPSDMLESCNDRDRSQWFVRKRASGLPEETWTLQGECPISSNPIVSLTKVIMSGQSKPKAHLHNRPKKRRLSASKSTTRINVSEQHVSDDDAQFVSAKTVASQQRTKNSYVLFIDLISKMLAYRPRERIKPHEALEHPFFLQLLKPTK